ncbi:hypothetical protein F4777DRAFT_585386 [Nemania sp. FL0916]|nr:hypothetical protein F4777DRAFT_585386 [Nemania sp. FL0916]
MPRKKNNKPPNAKGPAHQQNRQRFGPGGNRNESRSTRPHGYTLAEEARNTASNRRGYRGRDARLRYQPVIFISAGLMDPLEELKIPEQRASSTQAKPAVPYFDGSGSQSPGVNSVEPIQSQDQHLDNQSDGDSDSSEDVVVFKGRNISQAQQKSSPKAPHDSNSSVNPTVPANINLPMRVAQDATDRIVHSVPVPQAEELDFISLDGKHEKRVPSGRPIPNRNNEESDNDDDDDEEAAIIADYIANMQNDSDDGDDPGYDIKHSSLDFHSFSILRDLGGTDSDAIPSQNSSGDESGDELAEEDDDDEGVEDPREQHRLGPEVEGLVELMAGQGDLGLSDSGSGNDEWIPAINKPRSKKGASKKGRIFQGGSRFPSATKMAEAFDELDLMDMQSTRLQRSKKGPVSFGLSDSELEDALNVALKKDRLKKADKKRERQELRTQGLLGKSVNPHDLRIKYQGGMSLDDLFDEVEEFMLGTREQLILPPLDKGSRKIIHTIANTLNVKSKSAGAGTGRYPILYRSKATPPYSEARLEQAFSRVRRTWFPRVDVDEKAVQQARVLKRTEIRTGKSRVSKSSLVLREGDVVGQHAAEIGVENKGRAMLEKMGWSKGMSLGTGEAKGIIVPLTHVIKKSKAGLGDI